MPLKWWGKAVGGGAGFLAGGPIGAAAGLLIGHALDAGWLRWQAASGIEIARQRQDKLDFLFLLLGHLAKADGRVSESDIAFVERLMQRLALSATQHDAAILAFERGRAGGFLLHDEVARFRTAARPSAEDLGEILRALIDFARKEGPMTPAERGVIELLAPAFDVDRPTLEALLAAGKASPMLDLAACYRRLGVDARASDADVAKAYRRLVAQNHPDKLQGQGASSEALREGEATLRAVREAYERIQAARGSKAVGK